MSASPDPDRSMAERLAEIARAVARLSISHRDPEKFHVDKSEVVHELRKLARAVEAGR